MNEILPRGSSKNPWKVFCLVPVSIGLIIPNSLWYLIEAFLVHRSGQSSAARQPSNSKVLSAPQSHIQVKSEPMDDGYRLKYLPPLNRFLPRQVDYDASRDPRLKRPDLQCTLLVFFCLGLTLLTFCCPARNSGDKRDGAHLSHLHGEF